MTAYEFKLIRKGLRLSQRRMADMLGVCSRTVARWEKEVWPVPKYVDVIIKRTTSEAALHVCLNELIEELARNHPSALDTKAAGYAFRLLYEGSKG